MSKAECLPTVEIHSALINQNVLPDGAQHALFFVWPKRSSSSVPVPVGADVDRSGGGDDGT
jgi:hypothetical protein